MAKLKCGAVIISSKSVDASEVYRPCYQLTIRDPTQAMTVSENGEKLVVCVSRKAIPGLIKLLRKLYKTGRV